ncbi:hypothetical protein RB213_010022 [Colletotrichum asianum]
MFLLLRKEDDGFASFTDTWNPAYIHSSLLKILVAVFEFVMTTKCHKLHTPKVILKIDNAAAISLDCVFRLAVYEVIM